MERCRDANRCVFGEFDSQAADLPGEPKLGPELAVSFDNIRDRKRLSDGLFSEGASTFTQRGHNGLGT